MKKLAMVIGAAAIGLGAAGAANASRVNWSIGIDLPPIGAVVSSGPSYVAPFYGAPSYYPGRAYAPPVVYAEPAPVYAAPRYPAYVAPPVVYVRPGYAPRHRGWDRGRHDGWDRGRHDGWKPERRFDGPGTVRYRR